MTTNGVIVNCKDSNIFIIMHLPTPKLYQRSLQFDATVVVNAFYATGADNTSAARTSHHAWAYVRPTGKQADNQQKPLPNFRLG